MAFMMKNMSVIAYANGFTLWHYNDPKLTSDKLDVNGFFNSIHNLFSQGDKIMINLQDCYLEAIVTDLSDRKVTVKTIFTVIY